MVVGAQLGADPAGMGEGVVNCVCAEPAGRANPSHKPTIVKEAWRVQLMHMPAPSRRPKLTWPAIVQHV